jgi:hypothetical protein
MSAYLQELWMILNELAPWLFLGLFGAGLLHVLVPPGLIHRHLGPGPGGVIRSVLVGVPLPLCSCGVIPAAAGLKKDGASDGATLGFLISTPQTGLDSVAVAASFLGWPFAVFKMVTALVTGVVGGLFADSAAANSAPPPESTRCERSWREIYRYAIWELFSALWFWLGIGVLVAAGISAFVPLDGLSAVGDGMGAMFLMLVISLPLYVCATGSVPIAAALVVAGMPAGAAMVFLMAGPATNVATIGAVYRILGKRALIVYLTTIIVGSIGAGLLFDSMLSIESNSVAHVHEAVSWWSASSAVLLGLLLLAFTGRAIRARFRIPQGDLTLKVSGMTCGGCAAKVQRILREQEGVDEAVVDAKSGQAQVAGTKLSAELLIAAIEAAGFGAETNEV